MDEKALLIIEGKTHELPILTGSEGEKAIDISTLRQKNGFITLDVGFGNTGSCKSSITFMDGEKGILRYGGIPVEQLAKHSTFVETAYLLINGELPSRKKLNRFSVLLNDHSLVHQDMRHFFENFPRKAHPMGILSSMVNALRAFYPEIPERSEEEEINVTFTRLLSKVRTMAAMSYKISRGHEVVYPRHDFTYAGNFLNMMFDSPVRPYVIDEDLVNALNVFWILHADHEQNCSTAAVRLVGSARVNLYAAISAGICALWGPLHGGANQAVVEMLSDIQASGGDAVVPGRPDKAARRRRVPRRLLGEHPHRDAVPLLRRAEEEEQKEVHRHILLRRAALDRSELQPPLPQRRCPRGRRRGRIRTHRGRPRHDSDRRRDIRPSRAVRRYGARIPDREGGA